VSSLLTASDDFELLATMAGCFLCLPCSPAFETSSSASLDCFLSDKLTANASPSFRSVTFFLISPEITTGFLSIFVALRAADASTLEFVDVSTAAPFSFESTSLLSYSSSSHISGSVGLSSLIASS